MKDKENKLPFDIDKPADDSKKPAVKKSNTEKTREFIALVFSKNPVGAPRMYKTAAELEEEIGNYFVHCYEERIKLTISGLILYCGFSDRSSFYDYEKKSEFAHTIKKARALVAMHYEGLTQEAFPQGAIFMLKNLGFNAEEKIENTIKTKTKFVIGGNKPAGAADTPDALPEADLKEYTDYDDI